MQVKTQKFNAFRQEARGKRQEARVGEKARREKGKVNKKLNIRYFYKYGMLPQYPCLAASCLAAAGIKRAINPISDRLRNATFEEIDLIVIN